MICRVSSRLLANFYVCCAGDCHAVKLYDTIRDAILTCARKPTSVSLIYRTEPTTKKCKNRKKNKSRKQVCSEITVNSPGNPCSGYLRRRNGKGCSGKDLQKRKVLSVECKSEWVMEYQIIVSMTVGPNRILLVFRCRSRGASRITMPPP